MSGTYPPYGHGGQRRGYGAEPGYGEDSWYGSGHGYEAPGYDAPGYDAPGYEDAGERGYRGRRARHDESAYPARPGAGSTIPAQSYPGYDTDPYAGGPYSGDPYSSDRYASDGYANDPHRGARYDEGHYGGDDYAGHSYGGGRYAEAPEHPGRSAQPDRRRSRHRGYAEPEDYRAGPGPSPAWPVDDVEPAPGYPGYPGPGDLPVGRTRRRGRTAAIALTVTLAMLALIAFGGWLVARPVLAEWPAKLAKPERLAGLQLSTEPALQQAADEIAADIRKDVKVDDAVAAFYHDPSAPEKIVALVGGTAFLASPKAELEEAFRNAHGEGMSVGEVVPVNAGPLGGLARCASAEQKGEGDEKVPLSVCAWADHGSLLIGLFFHRPVNESAELLRTIRGEMLKR